MKSPEISVIVPVYNAEKYLEECLESIRNQSFEDFEVIMINDGSTDSSEKICQRFRKSDHRFVLINQENGGACRARNHGLEMSRGMYISFVDADDKIDPDFFSVLHNVLLETGADIVMCDFYNENGCESIDPVFQVIEKPAIFEALLKNKIYNRIMNKLYRKECLASILFPEGRELLEDAFWTAHVLEKAKRIAIIPDAKYYYRVHKGSLSHKKNNDKEKAAMYRNKLEKYIVISRNYTEYIDKEYLITDIRKCLDDIIVASKDLTAGDVYDCARKLLKFPVIKEVNEKEFELVLTIDNPRILQRKYLKHMIFRKNTSVYFRILSLYRLIFNTVSIPC